MKKIVIVGNTNSSGAGSKGSFASNKKSGVNAKIVDIINTSTDNGAGSKGLFQINNSDVK